MAKELRTEHGYDLFVVASALQKAIRRNEVRLAGWAAVELFKSGYGAYAWRRLLIISAEDCDGIITSEIEALMRAHTLIQEKSNKKRPVGLVFIAKATLLLCRCQKNRDADHLGFLAKNGVLVSDQEALEYMHNLEASGQVTRIPDYVFDVHTLRGRMTGKTKDDFWKEEQAALNPKAPGLFDDLMEEVTKSKAADDPQS